MAAETRGSSKFKVQSSKFNAQKADFNVRNFDISADGGEVVLERVQEHSEIVQIDLAPQRRP